MLSADDTNFLLQNSYFKATPAYFTHKFSRVHGWLRSKENKVYKITRNKLKCKFGPRS